MSDTLLTAVIVFVPVLIVAVIFSWLLTRNVWKARVHDLQITLKEREGDIEAERRVARQAAESYERALADTRERCDVAVRELREQQEKQVASVVARMTAESEKILREREKQLTEGNKTNIEEILAPLRESIVDMKRVMRDNAESHTKSTTELSKQLEQAVRDMQEKTREVGSKAEDLAQALTGRPRIQGDFGENFLEDILVREGFENGLQYERQYVNDDLSRPDFILHFKEGAEDKDLIVDSKVSLTAYARYVNATDDETRLKALSEHEASVRRHIDELSAKEYPKKGKAFASFAIMFMPIDMALRAAIDKNPEIWQYAYRKGVLIATEQSIMPFIKIMSLTWRKFHQDSSIAEIMRYAEDMVGRVADFYKHYRELGTRLKGVCSAYNSGITQLEDHGQSITTSANQVMRLGVKASRGKVVEVPEKKVYLTEDDSLED